MLQINKTQSETSREPSAPETLSSAENLHLLVSFIRRQFSVILLVTVLTTALGVVYLITARPNFIAQAQLMIDTRKVQIFQQQSILGDIPIDAAQVESQVEVLRSENVASAVIKNLHLTEDPEFVGARGGLLGTLFAAVFNQFGSGDQAPLSEFALFRRAMASFQSRLSIKRVGLTYVIQIGFRSHNAERAAQIANAVAEAYITDQLEAKYQATRRASVWLQDRIKELRDQVSETEQAVVEFKTKNNIVSTGPTDSDRPLLNQQQVAELSTQLTIARAQTSEALARLDRINSVLTADLPSVSLGATVTDTLKNEVVTKLRSQYLDLAAREADWSAKYGRDHIAVVSLRNQMREIRGSIFDELKRLGETYKSDYEIAKQREQSVKKELDLAVTQSQETDVRSVTLRQLQSTAQTYKTIYDNFLQRYMESVQQQSFPNTEARLISSASRPLEKNSPRALIVLTITCLGGAAFGFGIGALRDMSDRVYRSGDQVESGLRIDCIALVPLLTTSKDPAKPVSRPEQTEKRRFASSLLHPSSKTTHSFALNSDANGARGATEGNSSLTDKDSKLVEPLQNDGRKSSSRRKIMRDDRVIWAVVDAPLSRYTEAIRSIKLASDLNVMDKASRVVGLTSSLPNEGKSTIAFSLAQLMSQVGARTILVDCDLRNPSLSRTLAPRTKIGLIDVIAEKAELEEAILHEPLTNLAFLPGVVKHRLVHSTEILTSVPLKNLFEKLRAKYDYVVVDLPPLAPVVDVRAATHLVDSFVFVIEWGRTKIDVVEHALEQAHGVYDNLLGVVLNKVDMDSFGRYANNREDFYYNKHYARYGYTE